MVPLDHHIRVVIVPHIVHHPEFPVVAEAALEVDNIEEKYNDNEKVHHSCSYAIIISIVSLYAINGGYFVIHKNRIKRYSKICSYGWSIQCIRW